MYFIPGRDQAGAPTADILFSEEIHWMPVRVVDVVRVNALAVPLDASVSYAVLQHELRLVLSYLPDQVDQPLCLRAAEFRASASHIQRFVTESFGLGMLSAAVESQFGWELNERSLEHFDVLPTALVGRYQATGVRPDLLFQFHGRGHPWLLAGEARGRSAKPPKTSTASAAQRRRLDDLLVWSVRHSLHPITMTWTYTGSASVQVDLFVMDEMHFNADGYLSEVSLTKDRGQPGGGGLLELPPSVIGARAQKILRASADTLYGAAPEPTEVREVFGRRVRGDWVRADLVGPSNAHLLLGILDGEIASEDLVVIRQRPASRLSGGEDPIQVSVMGRILIAVALGTATPPPWSEIIDRLQ